VTTKHHLYKGSTGVELVKGIVHCGDKIATWAQRASRGAEEGKSMEKASVRKSCGGHRQVMSSAHGCEGRSVSGVPPLSACLHAGRGSTGSTGIKHLHVYASPQDDYNMHNQRTALGALLAHIRFVIQETRQNGARGSVTFPR
jgi:hypothetical protein